MNDGNALTYNDAFFTRVTEPGIESARVIVPRVLQLVRAQSVIDIGCGLGAWLKVFQENGVKNIRGLDGDYVDQSRLLIDANRFNSVDLSQPININVGERYDLATCLEVAEHLPASAAPHLVRALTRLSPFVLFSAAIPNQGGREHINEQWPSYWKELFAVNGFQRLDPIRWHVLRDKRVRWCYRQNIFLFGTPEAIARSEVLREEERLAELDIVCLDLINRHNTLKDVLADVPRLVKHAVERRMHHPWLLRARR